ncbi:Hypothetical protein A7982_03600 [Minicystis rosea]|nr:Hypothetical protein A7982_03600 [Minicystis rosea]
MYVAQEIAASAVDDIAVDFTCTRCGHHAVAEVIAIGHGSAEAPFFIGRQAARDAAVAEAKSALPAAAVLSAGLAGCPSCAAPDPAALRRAWLQATLQGLATWIGVLVFVVALFGGLIGYSAGSVPVLAGAIAFFALVLAILAKWQLGKILRETRARVSWRSSK